MSDPQESLPIGPAGWELPPDGATLPPHTPLCMVCGPEAGAGFRLVPCRDGDTVRAAFRFGLGQSGAPGLAHGGAVAAVCDDLLGHVLTVVGVPAVTRRLEVEYRKPVVLGERHDLVAGLESTEGRKLWLTCSATGEDGKVRFTARGLFVRVGLEHFLAGLQGEERARAEEYLRQRRDTDGDVAAW